MKIIHVCDGWSRFNGAANIARLLAGEQVIMGHDVSYRRWATRGELMFADEVWIHCGWKPCLWWAALWAKKAVWVPEACYDPIRLKYHGWKKRLVGSVERWALRRCQRIVGTCSAEADWIRAYLGKRCPPIEVTDIRRFFKLAGDLSPSGRHPMLHVLYLGRRHPLKGLGYLERAVDQINAEVHAQTGRRVEFRTVSNAFGEDKERVWRWCDVLCLPTLSDNFGLVVAEALERGKRVVTTDGAPVWGEGELFDCSDCSNVRMGYGGRLVYLKGYRDGTDAERVRLLKEAIGILI